MNILLSYSLTHFDPQKAPADHKYWDSSANILARELHAQLKKLGHVTYIDAWKYDAVALKTADFDLFVGIYANFEQILAVSGAAKSLFFAVNMHPAERNRILQEFVRREGLPAAAIAGWDLQDAAAITRSLSRADAIVCVGNTATYNSYIAHGVPKTKLKMLNYAVGELGAKPPKPSGPRQLLYVSSDIGLRKGFDLLCGLFDAAMLKRDFKLTIIGPVENPVYQAKLKQLQERLGDRLDYRGWVDSHSKEYAELMCRSQVVLFPSLEEGQAGSVLDALRYGAVPLISVHTGIDWAPLGSLELEIDSPANRAILNAALDLETAELAHLQTKTRNYYTEFHLPFPDSLATTLRDVIAGQLYPQISIVLPIFNKEASILPLLRELDRACRAYGNTEAIIIFDGCNDNTEAVVRRFYRGHHTYPVHFEVTPNIFEIKTNNLGLRRATGRYGVIVQDDNFVYDPNTFIEAIGFLEKDPTAVVLGCLAGVNYFPRGTKGLKGAGQITMSDQEVYWRQDATTDPALQRRFFEVDACMRGPLILRKSFLEEHGYLDEAYAPLYQDDMDLGFRARKFGYKVYCGLFHVENKAFTMASYNAERNAFFNRIIKRNTNIFYKRWKPSVIKDYTWVHRAPIADTPTETRQNQRWRHQQAAAERRQLAWQRGRHLVGRGLRKVRRTIRGS